MKAHRQDIPVGRECAISRAKLARLWRTDERNARHIIASFRAQPDDDGYAILSTAGPPSGYWRSNNADEIESYIRETYSRAQNTFLAMRDAKRVLQMLKAKQLYSDRIDNDV